MTLSVFDTVTVAEARGCIPSGVNLYQEDLDITPGELYSVSYSVNIYDGEMKIYQGNQLVITLSSTVATRTTFTADTTGNYLMIVISQTPANIEIERIGLCRVTPATVANYPVKDVLSGNTDDGDPVFFRVDTQVMQIQPGPELYSNPIAVATETERGSQIKAFVSMDDKPFYQLEGTVTKGVSIVKMNSKSDEIVKPPLVQSMQLSFRDSSENLCRIIQTAIVTVPTPIDYTP